LTCGAGFDVWGGFAWGGGVCVRRAFECLTLCELFCAWRSEAHMTQCGGMIAGRNRLQQGRCGQGRSGRDV
jgi:hypothetical protein